MCWLRDKLEMSRLNMNMEFKLFSSVGIFWHVDIV